MRTKFVFIVNVIDIINGQTCRSSLSVYVTGGMRRTQFFSGLAQLTRIRGNRRSPRTVIFSLIFLACHCHKQKMHSY